MDLITRAERLRDELKLTNRTDLSSELGIDRQKIYDVQRALDSGALPLLIEYFDKKSPLDKYR